MKDFNLLQDIKIRKATPKEKEYHLSDGGGLSILIKSGGAKLWVMRYTSPTLNKRRKTSFGNYPMITLKMARDKRDEYIKLLFDNIDPLEDKKAKIKEVQKDKKGMCSEVINEWLQNESENTKENTHKAKKRVFDNDVIPFLKDKHISDVEINDVVILLKMKYKEAPEIASRLYNYLENLFKYSVLRGYCKNNILSNIRKSDIIKPKQSKHMPKITEVGILRELVNSIYSYEGSISVRNALKLVLHIPLRAENLCNLKWEYIDFDKKLLIIPRELMKIKNINLDDFIIPLTDEVINILEEQKDFVTKYSKLKEYIFIGSDNIRPIHKESPNKALKIMNFNDEKEGRKIRLHGFRGTFRSMVDTLDTKGQFSFEAKERALDHYDKNIVVRAYNHKANYLEQLKELMNWWSTYLCSLKQ